MSGAAFGRRGSLSGRGGPKHVPPGQGWLWDGPPDAAAAIAAAGERRGGAALLRYAFAQSAEAQLVVDSGRRVAHANVQALRLLGLGKGACVPPAATGGNLSLQALCRAVDAALRGGRVQDLVCQLRGETGTARRAVLNAEPLRDEAGRVCAARCTVRELPQGAAPTAGEALQAESARLVHEFNNILTVVLASLSMAAEEMAGTPAELVLAAQEAAVAAKALTEDVPRRIALAAADAGPPRAKADVGLWSLAGLQVSPAVLTALDALEPKLAVRLVLRTGQAVARLAGPGRAVWVRGDAAAQQGGEFEAVIGWQGGWAVHDGGVGAALGRLRYLLGRQGGRVDAALRDDRAELHLRLPVQARLRARPGGMRILVMDDDQTVREVASRILQSAHYEVAQATDGQAAIALFRKARRASRPFDLALLDLNVPGGMGGEEAGRQLLDIDPDLPILISTGRMHGMSQGDYLRLGFRGVVPKPYTAAELRAGVELALEGARSSA